MACTVYRNEKFGEQLMTKHLYKFVHKLVDKRDIPGAKLYTICGVMNNYVSLHKLNYVCIVFNT